MQGLVRALLTAGLTRQYSRVDTEKACQLACRLSKEAGKMMLEAQEQKREYKTKQGERDLVTVTDKAVERLIVSGIHKAFPDHQIIAEEGTEGTAKSWKLTEAPTWIIDPIDGTTNFVHGFPYFCTSIALYVEKQGVLGWIENPMLKHVFVTLAGRGFFFNGCPMQVSGQRLLNESLLLMETFMSENPADKCFDLANFCKLLSTVHGIRTLGSTALNLAQVAAGGCDAYLHFGSHVWDWAAGVLMVQEAGGVVIDPCGGPFDLHARRMLAAATPELAEQIVRQIEQLYPRPRDDEPGQ